MRVALGRFQSSDPAKPGQACCVLQVEDCGQSDNPAHAAHSPRRRRNFAVITFQSVKLGIGCPNHVLAGPALIGRKVVHKGRPRSRQKRDCRFVDIAVEQLLDFLDLSAIDL